MTVIMKESATEKQMKQVIDLVTGAGLTTQTSQDNGKTVMGLTGDTERSVEVELTALGGAEKSIRISLPYKLTSRSFHPENIVAGMNGVKISDGSIIVMTGPCSIESLGQIRECARVTKVGGAAVLQGGAFKPRASPYAFQGLEREGLKYIRQAADELDMQVITGATDETNLELVAKYSDILQIDARNIQDFKLLRVVGKTGESIGLKRETTGTIDEWLGAAEYIAA